MRSLLNFLSSDDATTAVEYAVMLAAIMLTCIVAIRAFGGSSSGLWGDSKTQLDAAGFSTP
jgi:pilus assembly protein Flp/PilA